MSFSFGKGVDSISVDDASLDLLSTQVKVVMNKMFEIIPTSRFIHLVGNGGSKVWSKWTVKMAVPWKQKMVCPLAGPDMPGCNCPTKKMV